MIKSVPSISATPWNPGTENALWVDNPLLSDNGQSTFKSVPGLDSRHSVSTPTEKEQQAQLSFDPGNSSTEDFAWDDFPSTTFTSLTDGFSPMNMGDFMSSTQLENSPGDYYIDPAGIPARRPAPNGRLINPSGNYNDPSMIPSAPETQLITSEDKRFESEPTPRRLIPIYRPSGPQNKIPPTTIYKYFLQLPLHVQENLFRMARAQDYSFIDIISAGIAALTPGSSNKLEMTPPQTISDSGSDAGVLPFFQYSDLPALTTSINLNPYINNLSISRISYFASMFTNASMFGFDFGPYLDENSTSPLYDPELTTATEADINKVVATRHAGVSKDLRPVMAQLTKKHHPYLDVLPFPMSRQKAITAASTDPPLLDEDDMCIDLMINEGLVCWGSPGRGAGMDMGAPWDMRSWEAKPWFLEKWWWLVGDKDDDMWSGSRWWRMIRRANG